MRYKESFVTMVNSLDDLSDQLKATNYEQIAKSLEKSSAGLNKAIESIVSKIDYDTIYKSITASSLAASKAIRSISENYSKILNTVSKIITDYSSSIETVYKSLNSFYNSKEFIALCETLINSNNYNYSEEDTKEVINSITYKDIENINKIEIKNDHSLPKQIILWLMITFILEPLIAIPQEQITNWYKEQIPKIAEFINNKYKQLSEISIFSTEKISVSKLNRTSYISTENMLPNLSGITESASLPKVDKVTSFKKGDILLSNIRPYFKKMWYATFEGGCSNDVLVIRSEEGIDSKYLYYFLSQPTFFQYVTETSKGTKMPRGDKQAIMKYSIYVPSSIVQKKIVKILESIDKKIVLNKKINNNLHELSDNLYNEWFVKFNFPNFDSKLKNSELGMIPEKWNVGYFDDGILTKIIKSGVQNYEGFKKYIATADVTNTDIINYTLVDYDNKPSRANMTPISSSVWFAKMENSIKNILVDDYMDDILNDYIFSTGFMGIECYKSSVNYIWSIINNSKFIDIKNSLSTGTLMAGISNTTIVNFKYIIPDDETLIQYNLKLREINKKIYNNKKQNETLSQLRDTLLPKLMNGEIDLDNIEI